MRSATSYFNGTLYRKTLARFWPLWAGYGVVWLFCIPLNMLSLYFNNERYMTTGRMERLLGRALNLPELLSPGVYFAAFFAILCAMAVFGYLYNSRSACWTHALPLRREALFTTQYLAGLSFLLLPQGAVAVLTAVVELSFLPMEHWGAALSALMAWLLAQSGVCLFFFSFAAFCAMFTGHILALPAFYGILNVLAGVIYELLDGLFYEFFFGYAGSSGAFQVVECLTPVYALQSAGRWWKENAWEKGGFQAPATIAVYAGVGVVLAFASLCVYRRRHVEAAGDVVAGALVRPLFKYGVSFCAGLCFGMFTSVFLGWNNMAALVPCILAWAVVGYFVAEMLLKKSFRVFKAWKGAAAMTAVLLVLCLACLLDLFGVEGRVPDPSRVESVQVYLDMGYPYDGGREFSAVLTDPEQIKKIVALHQAIVDNRDSEPRGVDGENDYITIYPSYTLSGGGTLNRRYASIPIHAGDLDTPGTVAYAMKQIIEDRELVEMAYDFDGFLKDARLTGAYLWELYLDGEYFDDYLYLDDYRQELWDAVQQDFAEGAIGVRCLFEQGSERMEGTYRTNLCFSVTVYQKTGGSGTSRVSPAGYDVDRTLCISLTPQAKHTLAVLDQTGIFEEGYSLAAYERRGGGGIDTTALPMPEQAG